MATETLDFALSDLTQGHKENNKPRANESEQPRPREYGIPSFPTYIVKQVVINGRIVPRVEDYVLG